MRSKVQCRSISRATSTALALAVALVLSFVSTPWVQAEEYSFCVVYSFKGGTNDGSSPYGGLVLDTAGHLYGTTLTGGYENSFGTVFKVDNGCDQPGKKDTVLHYFNPTTPPNDGHSPYDGLVLNAGILYGTTLDGGTHDDSGTVFKVSTTNKAGGPDEVVFSLFPGDGSYPRAGLVRDSAGNFYGTTIGQGLNYDGTVFKVGTAKPLHNFGGKVKGVPDGSMPYARLALDAAGNLIGTTRNGGANGYGIVFMVNKTGTVYKILYSFLGPPDNDGSDPYGGVVLDSAGNIYGTTRTGGADGYGTVYKLNSKGFEIAQYNFNSTNGQNPDGDLVLDSHGNVWGTTETGGQYGSGVVFELDNKLQHRIFLFSLFGNSDGAAPYAGLMLDSAGNLYGTTTSGGPNFNGTVFKLCPGGCE